jgi:hypothetical protein
MFYLYSTIVWQLWIDVNYKAIKMSKISTKKLDSGIWTCYTRCADESTSE